MQAIRCWRDLEPFGVDLLTAESCGYMFRYLCDLTERGQRIIEALFDCKLECHENWNSGGGKSVASIMLTPDMFASLAVFCLIDDGCEFIWIMQDTSVKGMSRAEHAQSREAYAPHIKRIIVGRNPPRHVHQMSGRTT
ncbi:MAG: hypothetical protein WD069_16190 [Planctomycetales bacterium]